MMIWVSHNVLDSEQQSSVHRKQCTQQSTLRMWKVREQRLRKEALDVTIIRAYLTPGFMHFAQYQTAYIERYTRNIRGSLFWKCSLGLNS